MKKNAWHEHPEVGAFLRELFGAAWSPELVIELADLSAEAAGTGALRARPEAADSGTAALSELLGRHAAAVRLIERTAGGADFEQVLLLFARGREFDGLEAFLRLGIDRAGRLATDAMRDMLLFLRLRLQALTPSDTGSGRRFLSLCRELGLFVACSGTYVPGLPEFYLRVREDIDRMGDRGGAALMDLLVGSLNVCNVPEHNSAEFHAAMTRGRKTLMELKDAALLEEAEPYLGIWAFVEGEYDEAMSFFSRASRRMRISGRRYFELFFARHWSFAAASRGDFDLAVKLLLSRLREADLDGASSLGRTVRSQLAALYLRTGRIEKALEELDICLTGIGGRTDIASAVTTVRHLAGYHALNGHYQEAWSVLAPVLRKAEAMGYQRPVYLSGALLEILFTLREHGLPPLPCYRFEDELERCLTGPNRLLRGTAQRIQGRLLAAAGRPGQAVHALRSAVSTLVSTHNALEADKTRLELARLILPDNEAEAALLVQEAWKSHAWLEEHYWPAELTRLVPSYLVRGGEEGAADRLLDACREIFGTRRPGITFAEYAGLLLSESARLLGASGSWLFHQARPGAELRLIESRTEPGAESPALRATLDDAAELVAEGEPVILADLAPGEAGHRDMFAGIPLDCRPYGVYVLCLAGPFTEQLRTCLDEAVLADMGRVLAWSCLLALETDRRLAGSGRAEEEDSRMIWASPVMRRFLADADRAAGTDASVLLCGESGAGKEMLARRLHERSGRSGRLVTINMASLQDELFESEFFGHEKGAFTGAMNSKLGLVEMADKGTLFLDELTEASPRVQAKLLRVLQERTFLRVGGTRPISINFRLVAATNRSMAQAVRQGLFRADLYYRTAVITLRVPPLRERREDILPLARYFLHHFARRHQTDCVEDFSEENRRLLEQWSWPGNVRELRNAVEQSVILSGGRRITLSDDPFADSFEAGEPDISRSGPPPDADSAAGNAFLNLPADLSLEEMERRYILAVLHRTNWRIDGPHGALRILKISRSALYAKIRRYGLRRENGSE